MTKKLEKTFTQAQLAAMAKRMNMKPDDPDCHVMTVDEWLAELKSQRRLNTPQ